MRKPPQAQVQTDNHPRCHSCRGDTYATQALKLWPDDKNETFYCDLCSRAMASVIKDSQGRDPEVHHLPPPPARQAPPVTLVPVPVVQKPVPALPLVQNAPAPRKPQNVLEVAREVEQETAQEARNSAGCDLLALMGWKT